jgi:flagellar motor switch protein FliM
MVGRLGTLIAGPLKTAWEPVARIEYHPGAVEANPTMIAGVDGDEAMVVTRFGIAAGDAAPHFLDLVYPVSALKPHAPSLTGKVHGRAAEPDPAWRNELTRAVMSVRFPVRSVLAEPVISLDTLLHLKAGDIIPIGVGHDVPVMVGTDRIGTGTVGSSNGHAAIKITSIVSLEGFST